MPEAEPLLRRALALRERVLGPDHPDVAQSLNNLAVVLRALDRPAEAEPLHRRALVLWERVLGEGGAAVPAGAGDPRGGA